MPQIESAIAQRLKSMSDGEHAGIRLMSVVQDTVDVGILPCCQTVSGRSADWRLGKTALKTDAPGRKRIQIGSMRQGIPKTAKGIEAEVITHENENIHDWCSSFSGLVE
jgi:hypothetical protein